MKKRMMVVMVVFFAVCQVLTTGCQIQVNLGSSVVNVPVAKTQILAKDNDMTGSDLEKVGEGVKQKSEATVPAVK